MDKEKLGFEFVCRVGDYGIIKCKEKKLDNSGRQYGKIKTWYDVCLDNGDGDIVASFGGVKEAKKWAKENLL